MSRSGINQSGKCDRALRSVFIIALGYTVGMFPAVTPNAVVRMAIRSSVVSPTEESLR